MISGSALGQRAAGTQRGMGIDADGTKESRVGSDRDWSGDDNSDSGTGRGKRKIGDVVSHDGVQTVE